MPLPTWYRTMRALPGVIGGLVFVGIGIYLAASPTTYRNPNDPKMVAYANSMHPVVIVIGVLAILLGLGAFYFGGRLYNRMPEGLREYSYEQLRLGQALAREIARLTKPEEFHGWSGKYEDGSELYLSGYSYYDRRQSLLSKIRSLSYGFGESVTFVRSQSATEIDGIRHVPKVRFYVDSFTGKADRHESVEQYEIKETPPIIGEDNILHYAIKEGIEQGDPDAEDAAWLVEPGIEEVHVPIEKEEDIEEIIAHDEFMKQMGLDKPSVEELQIALDQLKEW